MSTTPTTLVKGGHTVTSTYAPEIVSLRAQGYKDPVAANTLPEHDTGGILQPGPTLVSNTTGEVEQITAAPAAPAAKRIK